jgi:hypothetical protein
MEDAQSLRCLGGLSGFRPAGPGRIFAFNSFLTRAFYYCGGAALTEQLHATTPRNNSNKQRKCSTPPCSPPPPQGSSSWSTPSPARPSCRPFTASHKSRRAPEKKAAEIELDAKYKWASRTQLNEAEWAPLSCAVLFFLAAKGVEANLGSTLLGVGSVVYYGRLLTGPKVNLLGPLGACLRYAGMALLAMEIFDML